VAQVAYKFKLPTSFTYHSGQRPPSGVANMPSCIYAFFLVRTFLVSAMRTHIDIGTNFSKEFLEGSSTSVIEWRYPCMQLEAMHDEYKPKCFRLDCPKILPNTVRWDPYKTESDLCRYAKPNVEVAVGFAVSLPIFALPLNKLSVRIVVDGAMAYQPSDARDDYRSYGVTDDGYKSVHVSAGIEISVQLAYIGTISFSFTGSLTMTCVHCRKYGTLWQTFIALLIHDYFKFVRKSDKETAEVMKTLADGLKNDAELVNTDGRKDMSNVAMHSLAVTIEYAGQFSKMQMPWRSSPDADLAAKLKTPFVFDVDSSVEAARESRRTTTVVIAPLGPPKDDDNRKVPTYVMQVNDEGYEWASIARVRGKFPLGTMEATVQCGDSAHDFGFEVSLQSKPPESKEEKAAALLRNNTLATVEDWLGFVNKVLKTDELKHKFCNPGYAWGHRGMHKRVALISGIFSPMLAEREISGTEVVKVHIPKNSDGSNGHATVVLKRETDISLLPPKLPYLLGKAFSLIGDALRLQSKKVEDLGASNIQDELVRKEAVQSRSDSRKHVVKVKTRSVQVRK